MSMENDRIKIWFNPEKSYYEAFLSDGTPLPLLMKVNISDNFSPIGFSGNPTATIDVLCNVVNEKPGLLMENPVRKS